MSLVTLLASCLLLAVCVHGQAVDVVQLLHDWVNIESVSGNELVNKRSVFEVERGGGGYLTYSIFYKANNGLYGKRIFKGEKLKMLVRKNEI